MGEFMGKNIEFSIHLESGVRPGVQSGLVDNSDLNTECDTRKMSNIFLRALKLLEITACFIYLYWKHQESTLFLFATNMWYHGSK